MKEFEFIPVESTILRSSLNEGDCIGYFFGDDYPQIHVGVIKSFIADTKNQKAIVVLTDEKHIPLHKIRHRIKSNKIELTK